MHLRREVSLASCALTFTLENLIEHFYSTPAAPVYALHHPNTHRSSTYRGLVRQIYGSQDERKQRGEHPRHMREQGQDKGSKTQIHLTGSRVRAPYKNGSQTKYKLAN